MRDADPAGCERPNVGRGKMHAVGAPDVALRPTELLQVLDRRAPVELAAVAFLLLRLGEVRVQAQAKPPGKGRGVDHQLARDGKRRARRRRNLHPIPVRERGQPLRLGEHGIRLLDELVGRQPPFDSPRSMEPRDATMQTPSSRAACTSASMRPSRPRGKT
jgi:hypothetical protein